jgi:hypothetical protein
MLAPGDKIAVARPIFTPYLEIPMLNEDQLETVFIDADVQVGFVSLFAVSAGCSTIPTRGTKE